MAQKFMNVKEVAKLFRVGEATIYNWMARKINPMPSHKQGNTTRFIEKDVLNWFMKEK